MEENIPEGLLQSQELPPQLQGLLPSGYSYKLKKWIPHESKPNNFEATISTNVYTDDEAQDWWHEFNNKSNTTMRVRATCPKTGKVNSFKIYLRCLHQGRNEKTGTKSKSSPMKRNTNCPAGMIITIRRFIKYSRSKMRDPVDPVHPCEVQLRFIHNHPIDVANRFRPVSKEVEEKLLNLFQNGHSPASALETLKIDLQVEYGSLYSQIVLDRYRCPDKSFCYRLYYKYFGKDFASLVKKDLLSIVNSKAMDYNADFGETCVSVGVSGSDLVIAVCTPLMKRAHSLSMSGDAVFVDAFYSSSTKDKHEHHIVLLIGHTGVGGIPLGVVLTTSKNVETLTLGFQLLNELLSGHAFYGRGAIGPYTFLVDDSQSLRLALNATWTGSDVITCSFRILQTTWHWLWDEKHVFKDHQLYLLYLLKSLLFASNELEMNNKYHTLCTDAIAVHYPTYLQNAKCLWEKKHFWGLCFHQLLPIQGANNYYEAAVRALKDKVFEKTRNFNLVQVLNYTVTRVDLYYKTKVLDILNGKAMHVFRSHFSDTLPPHIINEIQQVAGNCFSVPSEFLDGKVYTVDLELSVCSCSVGTAGALCLHQFWIFLKMNSELFKVSYYDEETRQKLFFVVSGSMQLPSVHHTHVPIETSSIPLSHVPVECSAHPDINIMSTEPFFKGTEAISSVNVSSLNLQENQEFILVTPDTNCSQVNNLSENREVYPQNNSEVSSFSNDKHREALGNGDSLSLDNTVNSKETDVDKGSRNSDVEKRMGDVLSKFDNFCELVRHSLISQPEDFLPALEIMMKNLERKNYSSDVLISGLSFFGTMSAQPAKQRGKKKPVKVNPTQEILPKVHGRQMITYERKRTSVHNVESVLTAPTKLHKSKCSNQKNEDQ